MYKHVKKICPRYFKNFGTQRNVEKVTLKLLPINVQINTEYMETILSFKDSASIPQVCITIDTENEIYILVHWNRSLINLT